MSSAADQYRMLQMMRWFGPDDPVSLSDIRQAGCSGVVTALHHIANGEIWPIEDIKRRKEQIGRAGMAWSVVESLPVHEDIKTRSGRFQELISSYKTSLRHLAACGIRTVTYNFMPILDWTRTDVQYELEDGSRTLRFERAAFVAFDVYMLQRENAESDYLPEEIENARKRLASMSDAEKLILQQTILAGLPGSEQSYSLEKFRNTLRTYDGVNAVQLRRHLILFLQEIIPEAETLGMQMVIHPDDPPYPILKLPRVVSTYDDLQHIFNAVPSLSNGLCLCTGSLGVRADNDLLKIANTFSDRINFLHLRSTRRNEKGDFYEDNHLEGDVDMYAVLDAVVGIMRRRKTSIPMRPDHGHQMLDDLNKKTNPGYSAIGRLRGLAELRGLEWGILQSSKNSS